MIIDYIKRTFGFFDSNGLKHSIGHLNSMNRKVAYLSIEQQAKYADVVTVKNINNIGFLIANFDKFDPNDTKNFTNLNTVGVGNLAYLALNAFDSEIRDNCKLAIHNYRKYLDNFQQKNKT